ncbi:MAG TPA: hypothetical protein PK539_00985 [Candidatus Paceibacterota bacterium]|nr:hypothetical protein [Candidatus Paceibacterota bacterium]
MSKTHDAAGTKHPRGRRVLSMRRVRTLLRAGRDVFGRPAYFGIAVVGALIFFGLYLFVPVWLVPSNTVTFELLNITPLQYGLLSLLALMTGMLVSFEVFAFRSTRTQKLRAAGEGGVGLVASLFGGIIAAASCGCGIGILLGVVGFGGGALFVAENQTSIVLVMLGVVAIGVYFSATRAAGLCATCRV